MVTTIASTLGGIKDSLVPHIRPHVHDYLNRHGDWHWRRRQLDPLSTLLLLLQQVLHGNTAIHHLRQLAGLPCSASAYCQARRRLPVALLEYVSAALQRQVRTVAAEADRWRGHRLWRADATSFSTPDTPALQKYFGQPGGQRPGCGFPVATLLVLTSAAGFIHQTLLRPLRTHEASQLPQLHRHLRRGDVLVYDRAGCSYTHLALLLSRNLHAIVRMHQRQIVNFRPQRRRRQQLPKAQRTGRPASQWLARLGRRDQLVRWFKPTRRPRWMNAAAYATLPSSLVLRELRYQVRQRGYRTRTVTLASTLLDPQKYPADELAEQYHQRWQIEVSFRHLKQTMKMDVLKCQSVAGVKRELAAFVVIYNLVRLLLLRAARRQQVPPERLSFVDALRTLQTHGLAATDLTLIVNPWRPPRPEPRVRKRRPKPYPLMTQPRARLRQLLQTANLAA